MPCVYWACAFLVQWFECVLLLGERLGQWYIVNLTSGQIHCARDVTLIQCSNNVVSRVSAVYYIEISQNTSPPHPMAWSRTNQPLTQFVRLKLCQRRRWWETIKQHWTNVCLLRRMFSEKGMYIASGYTTWDSSPVAALICSMGT